MKYIVKSRVITTTIEYYETEIEASTLAEAEIKFNDTENWNFAQAGKDRKVKSEEFESETTDTILSTIN